MTYVKEHVEAIALEFLRSSITFCQTYIDIVVTDPLQHEGCERLVG
jgi:hypothetical protein